MKLYSNWTPQKYTYSAFSFPDQMDCVFDGNGFEINGQNKTVHLLKIHNCRNFCVKNMCFRNGSTNALRQIDRKDIPFHDHKCSVFEIIDGGAVVISGNSTVTFENCKFVSNKSLMCGGAVSNQSIGKVVFHQCTFEDNIAAHTGSAIDNLTKNSNISVNECAFKNNKSNSWLKSGSPHGQISVFPGTKAEIQVCDFHSGSIPFDCYDHADIISRGNRYHGYKNWDEVSSPQRNTSVIPDKLKMLWQLNWIVAKTFGKVYFRANP